MAIRVRDVNLPSVFCQLPCLRHGNGWADAHRLRCLAVLGCVNYECCHSVNDASTDRAPYFQVIPSHLLAHEHRKTLHQAHQICPNRPLPLSISDRIACSVSIGGSAGKLGSRQLIDQIHPMPQVPLEELGGAENGIVQGGEVRTFGKQFSQSLRYL